MRLEFETIKFFPAKEGVRGLLLKYFSFTINNDKLLSIGQYKVEGGALVFDANEKKLGRALNILSDSLENNLTCTITKNPATYIDSNSEVPLIGALEFGIIERGTNLVEVRPASGCNLSCIYCSVAEGPVGSKKREFLVEKDYLVEEFMKVAKIKKKPIEVFIETQGEPLLYADLSGMIKDLREKYNISQVTMVTNGTFLTEDKVISLKEAGLDRINWSINSLDKEKAKKIAGAHYDVDRIKELILSAKKHLPVLMCPVIMKGVNDDELEDFVVFAKKVKEEEPIIGFQNFLWYKGGRNPVDEMVWDEFNSKLDELEKKYDVRLKVSTEDFKVEHDEKLPKPFKKKDIVEVERLFPGRQKNEVMCKSRDRIVKVIGRTPNKDKFNVQIIRDKHNIFLGKAV